VRTDPTWGPVVSVSTGWSPDEEQRRLGSSGGVLTALSAHLLASGTVDVVVHVGAGVEDPLGAVTGLSTRPEDTLGRAGSRYQPAAPLDGLREALRVHRRVAVVGRPCDISAVRRLATTDATVREGVVAHLSFFCAGTPSRRGTEALIARMGVEAEELAALRFRGDGWPGLARATRHDGSSETLTYDESWGTVLNQHLLWRCKICPDGVGEFADISCGDAWEGGQDGYPSFEERAGRSLVLARTARGEELLRAAERAGAVELEPLDVGVIADMQPFQLRRRRELLARLIGARLAGRRVPAYPRMRLAGDARRSGLRASARAVLGTGRRAWRARRQG
jgi:coenzyme F420 hydrogenase subunit beta